MREQDSIIVKALFFSLCGACQVLMSGNEIMATDVSLEGGRVTLCNPVAIGLTEIVPTFFPGL